MKLSSWNKSWTEQQDQAETDTMLVATHLSGVNLQTFVDKLTQHQLDAQFASDIVLQKQRLAQDASIDQQCTMALGFNVIAAIGPDEFTRIMST